MFERRLLSHDRLWWAVLRAPLWLMYFVAPFVAGVLLSPQFAEPTPDWLGALGLITAILGVVYLNGLVGAFFLGFPLFYFLNAVRMQNRWIYSLAGFAGGTIVNVLYPMYSDPLYQLGKSAETSLAEIGMASYPILFGLMGMAVAWNFWRELTKEKKKKK